MYRPDRILALGGHSCRGAITRPERSADWVPDLKLCHVSDMIRDGRREVWAQSGSGAGWGRWDRC